MIRISKKIGPVDPSPKISSLRNVEVTLNILGISGVIVALDIVNRQWGTRIEDVVNAL